MPASWKINDTDCNQTDAPSIVRAQVATNDCLTPEPTSKEIVVRWRSGRGRTASAGIRARPPATRTLIAIDTRALSVCYFGGYDVLLASSWLEGDASAQLVTKLNKAETGANPDVPESQCSKTEDVPPVDAMLIAQGTQERAIIEVSFAGCTNRGLRNGRDTSRVSQDSLQAIMEPLHTGYGFSLL